MLAGWRSTLAAPFQIAPIHHFAITPLVMAYIFYHFTIASCATTCKPSAASSRLRCIQHHYTITPLHHFTITPLSSSLLHHFTISPFHHFTITPVMLAEHHTEVRVFQESEFTPDPGLGRGAPTKAPRPQLLASNIPSYFTTGKRAQPFMIL